jgi:hypothetical protein
VKEFGAELLRTIDFEGGEDSQLEIIVVAIMSMAIVMATMMIIVVATMLAVVVVIVAVVRTVRVTVTIVLVPGLQCRNFPFLRPRGPMIPSLNVEVKSLIKLEKACQKADVKRELGQGEHGSNKKSVRVSEIETMFKGVWPRTAYQRSGLVEDGGREESEEKKKTNKQSVEHHTVHQG